MERKTKSLYRREDKPDLRLVTALLRAYQGLLGKVGQVFQAGGLTPAQFSVLEVLYHRGDLKIGEIIEAVLSTGGNMTVILNNLEASQLIEKYADERDRRTTFVRITEAGMSKIEEVFPPHVLALHEYFSGLSTEEKQQLTALLQKLRNA